MTARDDLFRFAEAICGHPEVETLERILREAARYARVPAARLFYADGICAPRGDERDEPPE
jgi:hypothetical protein